MNILLWGTGQGAKNYLKNGNINNDTIIGYVENNSNKWGVTIEGKMVYSPEQISDLEFDKIIICSDIYFENIKKQCNLQLNIPDEKIADRWSGLKEIMIQKYKDNPEQQIQETLTYWKTHQLSVFNQFKDDENETYSEVIWDSVENMPYIMFENKKMYFPPDYRFYKKDGKQYVKDILSEQVLQSPHLYTKSDHDIKPGCVMVDAGVCEGNFALRFIDIVSKIYLIEPNRKWLEALRLTFQKYTNKVVFCEKMLSKENTKNSITLDTLVEENIDFLKMDIEGSEINALLGGGDILRKSNAFCSICSYHNSNDEKYIRFILESYGYKTDTSNGYMIFIHDPDIFDKADFRKGMVYAKK